MKKYGKRERERKREEKKTEKTRDKYKVIKFYRVHNVIYTHPYIHNAV